MYIGDPHTVWCTKYEHIYRGYIILADFTLGTKCAATPLALGTTTHEWLTHRRRGGAVQRLCFSKLYIYSSGSGGDRWTLGTHMSPVFAVWGCSRAVCYLTYYENVLMSENYIFDILSLRVNQLLHGSVRKTSFENSLHWLNHGNKTNLSWLIMYKE